ncbi:MAG: class I SAM-dependent methyltransferase [Elusimicrobia bacterium]|nr:class I SAM-dependent methyltransferase [Elusimicrobiota bacterium]
MKDKVKEFRRYLRETGQGLAAWLDGKETLERLAGRADQRDLPACLCGSRSFDPLFHYSSPPAGETGFRFSGGKYLRDVLRCSVCGHCISVHAMRMEGIYGGGYVDATYGSDGMRSAFRKIVRLRRTKSDNAGRVRAVRAFADRRGGPRRHRCILDVGSGLCVFLRGMKKAGWVCAALDPDPRAAKHARDVVGVKAVAADFMKVKPFGRYDAVSFNKVLEHVEDPVAMLARARSFLNKDGFVYVELPDAEAAAAGGPGREEFFIEHHHIFSAASFGILAARAGFALKELERLREPSTKYTLRGFLALP